MGYGRAALVFLAVFVAVGVATYAVRYYTADVRGRVAANETIKSGQSRIANYNLFFDRCAAVQGHEAQLAAFQRELEGTTDEEERARIRANVAGVEAQRARSIAEYNADAAKSYTRGQFRDSQLPYELDARRWIRQGLLREEDRWCPGEGAR